MTPAPDQIRQLRTNSLFSALDDAQIERVLATTTIRCHQGGEDLFRQGDPARHFFWLREGLVKLYRLSASGEEKVIEIIRPGQTFAEAIMFAGAPGHYHVNATFIEAGEVWCFDNTAFKELLRESVETCFRLMTSMSRRMHRHINEIDRLTLQTATDRVINYLLQNHQNGEVRLLTSKQTLAAHLSIKPETLSRTLKKLAREGLIESEGHLIRLLDLEALKARVAL